ncbi:MAG: cytochrome P450 [Acidimicrobiales bacterium]
MAERSQGDLAELVEVLSSARRADPYPGYAALRESRPVWRATERFFVLSRHRDCAEVLRDPRFGHAEGDEVEERRRAAGMLGGGRDGAPPPMRSFLGLNPPDHTRLRRLVSRAFTPRRVDELAPQVRQIIEELLLGIGDAGSVDLVDEFASPLPVRVICELLGVPRGDRQRLVEWSHALAKGLDPGFLVSDAARVAQARAREEFAAYLVGEIAERRHAPGQDLLSALVTTHDSGDALTEAELVATSILLLVAGHETTTSLIANGMLALLRHPDQLEQLRARPELAGSAVEELLRFDSPVQLTVRMALGDASVGDVGVPAGSFVLLLLGAANRDPDVRPDPDRLDIARTPNVHLAFGQGIHFCLGAPLARLEAKLALERLANGVGEIRLAGTPLWKDTAVLRGVRHLEVEMTPAARTW